jgi:polyisoprenoid-binding protein YceI
VSTIGTTTDLNRFTGTWTLDPQKTSIAFRTTAMWIFTVNGTARALSGAAAISPDGSAKGTLVIDAASFDTKNKRRDNHLRTDEILGAARHPTIIFEATDASPDGAGRVEIKGRLTVRGKSLPLTLHGQVSGSHDSATVSTEVEIDRGLWGITWGAKMGAGLKNRVTVSAHFDRA